MAARLACYGSGMVIGDHIHQQLAAYVLWLEERGLVFPTQQRPAVPFRADLPKMAEDRPNCRVLFISHDALTPSEDELFHRMLAALGLTAELAPLLTTPEVSSVKAAISEYCPLVVVLLGQAALRAVVAAQASYWQLRGRLFYVVEHYGRIPFLASFHPRDLLRFPGNKRQAWEDLQIVMAHIRGGDLDDAAGHSTKNLT